MNLFCSNVLFLLHLTTETATCPIFLILVGLGNSQSFGKIIRKTNDYAFRLYVKPLNQPNWKKEQLEKVIGMCGIVKVKHGYEVGYLCHVNYTRKGYVSETVKAVLDYAVNTLHENKFLILTQSSNEASTAIAKKLGFVEKATKKFYSEQRPD